MLVDGKRALAYIVTIDSITPIKGADNIELAHVGGWSVIVGKEQYKDGDIAVFAEIDSKLPDEEWSEFLRAKHFKVKSMKLGKFNVVSQGLLLPIDILPDSVERKLHTDVTDILGITYATKEDNKRKANADPDEKYKRMARRHPKMAKKKWFQWLMRRNIGKKLLFVFLGKAKDAPKGFPSWIKKTDEERVENMMWVLDNKNPFVVTEKIDGTSTTVFIDLAQNKPDFGVCSRNVRQADASQENYHTSVEGIGNVYWEMAIKYNMQSAINKIADEHGAKRVVIQGETYGSSVQGNPYKLNERMFAAFNLVIDGERLGSIEAKNILDKYDIPFAPIISDSYITPDDFEEFKLQADGKSVINDKCRREGFVYRSPDGKLSFKNISREFLLKQK